jgi:protein-S-isoprenylcysteine O-methyltransferase Ste14
MRLFPPPVLFMFCLAMASVLERFWPLPISGGRLWLAVGIVILTAAAILGTSAFFVMRRARTPIEPGHVPTKLVSSGPFRLTRNPLYVTLLLIQISIGLMMSSAWLLVGAAALLVLLDRLVVVREERVIREHFGDAYEHYKARVRRWI